MQSRSVLTFDLDGRHFGLDTYYVVESVWLPELTPIEQAPFWVVGMFSLRGPIVAAIDLHLCLGLSPRPYRLTDQVLVLQTNTFLIGLIVSQVLDVIELPLAAINSAPEFEVHHGLNVLSVGVASIGENLVTLLDVTKLPQLSTELHPDELPEQTSIDAAKYADISAETRQCLHARALALRSPLTENETGDKLGVAVIELGEELIGIDLSAVLEFCNVRRCHPVPCCPPHIIGVMNLRGNLLTLIDPRSALNLPPGTSNKAVIVQIGEQSMAIAVEDITDIIYLSGEELHPPPSALRDRFGPDIIGTASHCGKTMTIFNLATLMARDEWIVDQSI